MEQIHPIGSRSQMRDVFKRSLVTSDPTTNTDETKLTNTTLQTNNSGWDPKVGSEIDGFTIFDLKIGTKSNSPATTISDELIKRFDVLWPANNFRSIRTIAKKAPKRSPMDLVGVDKKAILRRESSLPKTLRLSSKFKPGRLNIDGQTVRFINVTEITNKLKIIIEIPRLCSFAIVRSHKKSGHTT
jgi:hypothetical protein